MLLSSYFRLACLLFHSASFLGNMLHRSFDRLKISTGRLSAYRTPYTDPEDQPDREIQNANLTRGVFNGFMSQKSRSTVKFRLMSWIGSVQAYFSSRKQFMKKIDLHFTFVTLTLPSRQNHTDQELKRNALDPFIRQLKRVHRVKHYFWVCEVQKNDNAHFHLIIDRAIDALDLRKLWNGYMEDLGYIDDYRWNQELHHRDGFKPRAHLFKKWPLQAQIQSYIRGKKSNWSDPNSTDIHSLKKIRNLGAYCSKYLTKETDGRKVEGRLWGCSDGLRDLDAIDIPLSEPVRVQLRELAQFERSRLFEADFSWTIYRFSPDDLFSTFPLLYRIWSNYCKYAVGTLYPITKNPHFFRSSTQEFLQQRMRLAA